MRTFTISERAGAALNLLPTAIYDTFPAVLFGRLLTVACTAGIFESIAGRALNNEEISKHLGLHAGSLELLMPVLEYAGYVKHSEQGYSLSAQSRKWLIRSSPHYIGNFLEYIGLLQDRWTTLGATLRDGKPPAAYRKTFSLQEWRVYVMGMMDLARLTLPHLASRLHVQAGAKSLLDVCGSHGLYSIELCMKHPGLRATIADLPEVLGVTKEIIAHYNLEERITLLPMDVTSDALPRDAFDVVLAFNIIHGFAPATNARFIQALSASLSARGTIYFLDQLKRQRGRGLRSFLPLLVGLNLMNEIGGSVYSINEIRDWCKQAGLAIVRHWELRLPGMDLIRATRE